MPPTAPASKLIGVPLAVGEGGVALSVTPLQRRGISENAGTGRRAVRRGNADRSGGPAAHCRADRGVADYAEGCRRRTAEAHRGGAGEICAGDGYHRPRAPADRGERGDGRRWVPGEGAGAGGRAAGRCHADGAGGAAADCGADRGVADHGEGGRCRAAEGHRGGPGKVGAGDGDHSACSSVAR